MIEINHQLIPPVNFNKKESKTKRALSLSLPEDSVKRKTEKKKQ